MSATTTLEVYADIWCPFAHVGLRAAVTERSRLSRQEIALVVRAWPLELVNGAPLEVEKTVANIRALREQVAPDLFTGFDPDHFPTTTLPALALAAVAYQDDLSTGEAVSLALRDALFESGLDISKSSVLEGIARTYHVDVRSGLNEDLVRGEWKAGRARGVKGSPHFFCGTDDAFCPALDIVRDAEGHVLLQRNADVLSAFLAKCFDD